jgi:sigma-B regulation protein RsbQ
MSKAISEIHNIHITGKGTQPMLFAHGFGCDQTIWRYVTKPFEDKYKVVLFDYIGSGKSDITCYNDQRHNSLHGYADDVLTICKDLQLRDVIFVGHSVSCMIGLLAAIRQPGLFSHLIMVSPSPCYINEGNYKGGFERRQVDQLFETMERNFIEWASFLGPAIVGNTDRPELGEEMKERFCQADYEITKKFARVTFFSDSRDQLNLVKVPVLIMQCTEDVLVPIEVGQFMQDRMPGSTLQRMKASGHCPHLSAPNETVQVIEHYLAGTSG